MFKCALCFSLLKSCGPPNDIISFFGLRLNLLIPDLEASLAVQRFSQPDLSQDSENDHNDKYYYFRS